MPTDRLLHPRAGKSRKVTMLTDLEFRVWVQYILSADDFGVMHATPVELQSKNLHLACRRVKEIQRCIDALVTTGLVRVFLHQGQPYLCQHDWQDWQRVTWPSKTINPCPPSEVLATFTTWTQLLFTVHPGAQKAPKKPDESTTGATPAVLQSTAEVPPILISGTSAPRAGAPAKRLTANANGLGLTAQGSEPLDVAFRAFQDAYPKERRKGGHLLEVAFVDQAFKAGGAATLVAALEGHKRSAQWADPRLIPGMDVWLREERWRQELPTAGSVSPSRPAKPEPEWVTQAKAIRDGKAAHP